MIVPVVGRSVDLLPDIECPPVGGQCARGVSQIVLQIVSLDGTDLLVGSRQFSLQPNVAGGFLCKQIQILKRPIDNDFSRRRRTRQILDGIMYIKNERIGEASD